MEEEKNQTLQKLGHPAFSCSKLLISFNCNCIYQTLLHPLHISRRNVSINIEYSCNVAFRAESCLLPLIEIVII